MYPFVQLSPVQGATPSNLPFWKRGHRKEVESYKSEALWSMITAVYSYKKDWCASMYIVLYILLLRLAPRPRLAGCFGPGANRASIWTMYLCTYDTESVDSRSSVSVRDGQHATIITAAFADSKIKSWICMYMDTNWARLCIHISVHHVCRSCN